MEPIDALVKSLPDGRVLTDPDVADSYARDRTFVEPGKPLGVVLAASRDDVVTTLRWATEHRVPVVPRGAGTGLAGGATASEGALILSLARMTAIKELSPADEIAVVEPGVITADLDRAAREHGLMYAPDPSSYEISTIGGNLATNAGGLRCVKYGVTRDSALGLEVVLADGRILDTGRRTMKGVTGYDLTGLFVGSEGTLGVITAATVRLRRAPVAAPGDVRGGVRLAARRGRGRIGDHGGRVPAVADGAARPGHAAGHRRLAQHRPGVRHDGHADRAVRRRRRPGRGRAHGAELCVDNGASFVAVSTSPQETEELIGLRRMAYQAKERLGACLVEDVCVPRSVLPDMITAIEAAARAARRADLPRSRTRATATCTRSSSSSTALAEPPAEVWAAADEVFTRALELGGTLTGEHGVGLLKQRWLALEIRTGGPGDAARDQGRVRPARPPQPRQGHLKLLFTKP